MPQTRDAEIAAILAEGKDLTVATLRPDGAPQATVVSYASDGVDIYFGCGAGSQKARNLTRDGRVAMTVTLPYRDWAEIRGLSVAGTAQRLTDPDELGRVGLLFLQKFPEAAQYVDAPDAELAMFKVTPRVVSILDYAKGFGHTELVERGARVDA
jgi:PPOX class probable F420-dependent enzyme